MVPDLRSIPGAQTSVDSRYRALNANHSRRCDSWPSGNGSGTKASDNSAVTRNFMFALLWLLQTITVQLADTEIVRRHNFVVAATTDGYICYGTREPMAVNCHRAVDLRDVVLEENVTGAK